MKNADYWIEKLRLTPHPEGGYYKEVYRSDELINIQNDFPRYNGKRCFSTSIYFLLKGKDISHFHKILSDETWHFYDGTSLSLHLIDENGKYSKVKMGNSNDDELLQFSIKRNTWFAAEVNDKNSFSLIGCTVAPGFDFNDFQLARKNELKKLFPKNVEIINEFSLD